MYKFLKKINRFVIAAFFVCMLFCSFINNDNSNIAVVFIGDSITQGPAGQNHSPPKFAGDYLKQKFGEERVQVSNMGRSGFTTVNFLPGHNTFNEVKAAANTVYRDDKTTLIFSVMLGTNDSAIKGPTGAPVIPKNYRSNLKLIADSLLNAYPLCRVVINHPIWYSDNTQNYSAAYLKEGQQRVLLYEKEIDSLIDDYKKERLQHVFVGDKKAYRYFKKNYSTDFNHQTGPSGLYFLHPNQKGDRALGEFWAKAILKVLR